MSNVARMGPAERGLGFSICAGRVVVVVVVIVADDERRGGRQIDSGRFAGSSEHECELLASTAPVVYAYIGVLCGASGALMGWWWERRGWAGFRMHAVVTMSGVGWGGGGMC